MLKFNLMNAVYTARKLALLIVVITLAACGGGSGGGGEQQSDEASGDSTSGDDTSVADDVVDDSSNDGADDVVDDSTNDGNQGADDSENLEPDDSLGNDESSDTNDDENVDPEEGGESVEDSSTETSDSSGPIAIGGRRIETLLASGMPAPGFPGEEVRFDTDELVFSESGQIAMLAAVSGEPVIFVGDSSGLRPLIRRGDAMDGVANTVRFGDASELQWTSDDRLGFEVSLIGTETRTGYAIAEGNSVEVVVVPGISQVTDAQGGLRTVTEVNSSVTGFSGAASSISSAGVALQIDADRRLLAILPRDGELQFVTRQYPSSESELEERLENGCPFGISEFSNETIRYFDDGSLIFEANEGTERGDLDQCSSGTTLIHYANGVFSTVIGRGDAIPGPVSEDFNSIILRNEVPTERIIVTSGTRSEFAVWDVEFPPQVNLIALDGESVQLATRSGSIDLGTVDQIDARGDRIAMIARAANSIALLAGNRGEGQPHASFEEPGSNSLPVIVSGDGPIPDGFSSTGFWSELSRPSIASADTLYFVGRISDAISDDLIDESLWESDFNGELSLMLSVGDEVEVGENAVEPITFGPLLSPAIDLTQNVVTTPEGGLILMVNTNVNPLNSVLNNRQVLIHLPSQ